MRGRACPLCQDASATTLADVDYVLPEGSSLPAHTRLQLCSKCQFAFINSNASEDAYLKHYQEDSLYADVNRAGGGISPHDRARLEKVAIRLAPFVSPGSLLIDIGASTGGMLRVAREALGVKSVGIDPDERCVAAIKAQGFEGMRGTFETLPEALFGKADVVVLNHVLEHLWNPLRELRRALKLLRPGGVVYVETPNSAGYLDHPNVWRYYLDPEHINHFQPTDFASLARQLDCLLLDCGSASISLEGGTLYPVCWALLKNEEGAVAALTNAHATIHPIEEYLRQQDSIYDGWHAALETARRAAPGPFLIWGTGSHAQRVLGAGLLKPDEVVAFIDSDPAKQGKSLLGRPVLAPRDAFERYQDCPLAVLAARAAAHAIGRVLVDLGRDKTAVFIS